MKRPVPAANQPRERDEDDDQEDERDLSYATGRATGIAALAEIRSDSSIVGAFAHLLSSRPKVIEIRLENHGSRFGINTLSNCPALAPNFDQAPRCLNSTQSLVPQSNHQTGIDKPACEIPGLLRLVPLGAIHILRKSHDHATRVVQTQHVSDMRNVRLGTTPRVHLDGCGQRSGEITHRDSDAPVTDVEPQQPATVIELQERIYPPDASAA